MDVSAGITNCPFVTRMCDFYQQLLQVMALCVGEQRRPHIVLGYIPTGWFHGSLAQAERRRRQAVCLGQVLKKEIQLRAEKEE